MVFPGHIAAGYLVAYGVVHVAGLPLTGNEQSLLLGIGALLGDAPDIDIFYNFFRSRTTRPTALAGHRDHVTHAPVFWLVIGLSVYALSASPFLRILGLLLWLCPWAHLLGDSIFTNTGVRWLWPLSVKNAYVAERHDTSFSNWKDLLANYAKNPLFYIEAGVTLAALIVFACSW